MPERRRLASADVVSVEPRCAYAKRREETQISLILIAAKIPETSSAREGRRSRQIVIVRHDSHVLPTGGLPMPARVVSKITATRYPARTIYEEAH